ncbi:open rectifier potassium channel protein 1 [Schistocerca nitens]|uniref:open rectifier potassium channel protein 1 n=1 Tax=Schistocerca nitens TaxID=7011 RepID=UPI002118A839|nr:open rectifier potassium channel protein 1 [Schistocerca nitens]
MSEKQWLALLLLFVTYLLFGAGVFYYIERQAEKVTRAADILQRDHIIDMVDHYYWPQNKTAQRLFLEDLSDFCGRDMTDPPPEDSSPEPKKWTFYNSFFFVVTVVSTIGYGNLSPTTDASRLLMIFYALIGIPMNGILLATLGDFYSRALVKVHRRYKSKESQYRYHSRTWLVTDTLSYLVPGVVVFIFLPAAIFSFMEDDWDYAMSVYYAFVTLTTIGFGDLVAGQTNMGFQTGWFLLYQIMLLVWVIFGLGYLVMILGFITRAMRSKRMARLEHKLAHNLKVTQARLWHGIAKDAVYLRRVVNEMYLQKLKPVYRDDELSCARALRTRSSSEPCLHTAGGSPGLRRRANSDFLGGVGSGGGRGRLPRVMSETDLGRIDRAATFATAGAAIRPAELLARVVGALSNAAAASSHHLDAPESDTDSDATQPADREPAGSGGVHGFSDEDILASERGWRASGWTVGGFSIGGGVAKPAPKFRARAASEARIPAWGGAAPGGGGYNAEWTWTGGGVPPSKWVHQLVRQKSAIPEKPPLEEEDSLPRPATAPAPPTQSALQRLSQAPRAWLQRLRRAQGRRNTDDADVDGEPRAAPRPSLLKRMSLPAPDLLSMRRGSSLMPEPQYVTITGAAQARGHTEHMGSVLEETSLADFLRALSSVHDRFAVAGIADESPGCRKRRKMGTASLTPPLHHSLQSLHSPASPPTLPPAAHLRRGSLWPTPAQGAGGRRGSLRPATPPVAQLAQRRSSLRPPPAPSPGPPAPPPGGGMRTAGRPTPTQDRRRFSVRPVPEGQLPSLLPANVRTLRHQVLQRQMSDTDLLASGLLRHQRHDSLSSVRTEK